MPESITERTAQRAGVWDTDAPDGYVALVVFSSGGRRLIRIEISEECYSAAWITWLERWLVRWDSGFLRIVR